MMPGPVELLIILVIVLLLFGANRISNIGGELGSAISNFRRGLREGEDQDKAAEETPEKEKN